MCIRFLLYFTNGFPPSSNYEANALISKGAGSCPFFSCLFGAKRMTLLSSITFMISSWAASTWARLPDRLHTRSLLEELGSRESGFMNETDSTIAKLNFGACHLFDTFERFSTLPNN
ncbi:hypothetical protein NEOLI_002133 [Neolecta irregularis DAH-3]|uniref:Uncharacterized protein n=1 Tax=Neolecta irregularis (strain DAH-3) TaxID=1198029 RepID=A0A1U7LHM0_NEOID|nr:hypothetical protein NEOLI_002133 [Neolecta irregularis DAH-3]|eukprot:OLL22155.1 hypothetical protein NEOLI_002133 [Neolecta irregularis DAH-3]